jgi:hypothetical protein
MLTRDQILQADDLPCEEVEVPEWGGSVFVRTMTGTEHDAYNAEAPVDDEGERSLANFRARMCVRCLVDADGNRLFQDGEAAALGERSTRALGRVFEVIARLNGLDEEEIVKNSEAAPSGDSGSG